MTTTTPANVLDASTRASAALAAHEAHPTPETAHEAIRACLAAARVCGAHKRYHSELAWRSQALAVQA